jgi:hypothetical protein
LNKGFPGGIYQKKRPPMTILAGKAECLNTPFQYKQTQKILSRKMNAPHQLNN